MTGDRACAEAGFSLVETLVALLILAVAAGGLVRAAEAHVDTIRGLQARATAELVAQNRLVELGLGLAAPGAGSTTVEMLGSSWTVAVVSGATDDPDLAQVEVRVAALNSATPLAVLTGFVDLGATRP